MRVYILDVAADELSRSGGPVFGFRVRRDSDQTLIINGNAPRAGSEVVAHASPGSDWPQLESEGGRWRLRFSTGQAVPVEVIPYSHDYTARHAGIVDATELATKRVVIVGAGSLGSPIAHTLCRGGVGALSLIDYDRVELPNLCRSGFTADQLGQLKVEALAEQLVRANPRVELELHPTRLTQDMAAELLHSADLIVSAASTAVGFMLAAAAHRYVPVLFPALHARAASGEVFVSLGARYAQAACFSCYRAHVTPNSESAASWNYDAPGRELAAEPGLGADIGHVATVTASLALNILAGSIEQVVDGELLLLSNRSGALALAPYASQWVHVERDAECPNHANPVPATDADLELLQGLPEATC